MNAMTVDDVREIGEELQGPQQSPYCGMPDIEKEPEPIPVFDSADEAAKRQSRTRPAVIWPIFF
jgi:hypothetical protein